MAPRVRYARPRLITTDDKRYRAYVEHFVLQRQNHRASRPPRQRDIFGQQAENVLRDWLTTRLRLAETRILGYEEIRGRHADIKYRELDALFLENSEIAWVFEIKATRTTGSLRRAVRQLRETRDILRLLYPIVYTTILFVDTGIPTREEVATLMCSPDAPIKPPETLDQALDSLPQVMRVDSLDECGADSEIIDLLYFQVADIIALAGADQLALDWEADDEPAAELSPSKPTLLYSTADPQATTADEPDNPLAAALRRAGLTEE